MEATDLGSCKRGYGLEDYLTGEIKIPQKITDGEKEGTMMANPEFQAYQRQDQLLASWLLSSLSESLLVMMVGLDTARDLWNTLEINFSSQTKARKMQYKLELQSLKKGSLSMRDYLNKVKICCDALASVGHKVSDEDHIMHILSGLSSEYNPVMVVVTSKIEAYIMRDVCALLMSYENRLEFMATGTEEAPMPSANIVSQGNERKVNQNYNGRGRGSPFRGGKSGSGRGFPGPGRGFTRGRGGRSSFGGKMECQICGYDNHFADTCYWRDPSYSRPRNNQNSRNNSQGNRFNNNNRFSNNAPQANHVSTAQSLPDSSSEYSSWFPDSGASSHVTYGMGNFNLASEYQGSNKLHLGNGSGSHNWGCSTSREACGWTLQV